MINKKYFSLKRGIVFFGVAALFIAGFLWQMDRKNMNHGSDASHVSKDSEPKSITYVCPMHPQITSDKPGQSCPICGMDLVETESDDEEEDHSGHGGEKKAAESEWEEVAENKSAKTEMVDHSAHNMTPLDSHTKFKLSLKKQQMIGVKMGKVEKRKLFKSVSAPGRIAFDPDLYTAQSEYLEALRQRQRVKGSSLSDVQRSTNEMIKSAKIRLRVLGLSDGQIKSLARKGSQSEGLLVTGKGQENWVYADIFEVDLPYIKKGQSVQITANFLQGKVLPGKVISVDQVINADTRTAKVRIQLIKSDVSIRPQSYVNVAILVPLGEHLSVPIEALMDTGKDTFVFVKISEGKFEPRRVGVLLETGDFVAIGNGLSENEEIVTSGNFLLDSESRLKAVIKGSSAAGGHNH